jgi:hypothetical protein
MRKMLTVAAILSFLLAGPAARWTPLSGPARAETDQPAVTAPSGAGARSASEMEREVTRRRFQYLMLGYGLIWVSLGYFLFDLNRKVQLVGRDIDELKGRLDHAQGRRGD